MKLSVDARLCTGHGRCYSIAPGLLSSDEDGNVTISGLSIEVPAEQSDSAREAAASCPEKAVTLEES